MFVPPYNVLVAELQLEKDSLDADTTVRVPAKFLKFLLQCLLAHVEFDGESYLRDNPSIKEGLPEASTREALLHFIRHGYFEGRRGGSPIFDETWYLKRYSDVSYALETGVARSASDHYHEHGSVEWRAPNQNVEVDLEIWREILGRKDKK